MAKSPKHRICVLTGATGVLGRYFPPPYYRLVTRDRSFQDLSAELKKLLSDYSVDFFHFAAVVGDQNFNKESKYGFGYNESLTSLLAKEIVVEANSKFHLVSSGHVYGSSIRKINESQIPNPIGIYAQSKMNSESEAIKIFKDNSDRLKIYRVFSLLGPKMNPGSLSFYLEQAVLNPQQYPIKNSLDYRDFLHPETAVKAIVRLSQIDTTEMIFNVCSGLELTVKSAVEKYLSHAGVNTKKMLFIEERSNLPMLIGDPSLLISYMGDTLIKKDFLHAEY